MPTPPHSSLATVPLQICPFVSNNFQDAPPALSSFHPFAWLPGGAYPLAPVERICPCELLGFSLSHTAVAAA